MISNELFTQIKFDYKLFNDVSLFKAARIINWNCI